MPPVDERVRDELADRRRAGASFDEAWPAALGAALRGESDDEEWTVALGATRGAWLAAYAGAPASNPERALTLVGEDREPLVEDVGRRCERCEEPMPAGKPVHARYCSRECQRAMHGRRVLSAAAEVRGGLDGVGSARNCA